MKGCLVTLVGPAGVGKNKILELIFENYPKLFSRVISYTTRRPRVGEVNGEDYYFVSEEKFKELIDNKEFIEYDIHAGKYYGTAFSSLLPLLDGGKNVIKIINVNGLKSLRESLLFKDYLHICFFIDAPSKEECERRLRGREDINMNEEAIIERMNIRELELKFYRENKELFDYYVVNDELELVASKIVELIKTNI